ncbi:MAG: tail fiber domain-containing protein [Pyrinomonadaceae bacterium]
MTKKIIIVATLLIVLIFFREANGQSTELTYQGQLQNSSAAANGVFDFEFALFGSALGGVQLGSTVARNGVNVTNGIFSVQLDFGSQFDGSSRFLEIRVRTSGSGGFTTLFPRQPLQSTPYSVRSLTAESANNALTAASATNSANATNAVSATTALNFTGGLAGDVVGNQTSTSVQRLRGVQISNATPQNDQVLKFNSSTNQWGPGTDNSGGSVNAILNQSAQQAGANFNISGVGTADIFNASTQFNISGSRVFSITGLNNLFVGPESGTSNTSGQNNSFFGRRAGSANTSGLFNSFLGFETGFANTTGGDNAFFGSRAGSANTTGNANTFIGDNSGQSSTSGSQNSFLGLRAGETNTTGSLNTALGFDADFGSGNLTAATAIGAGAIATASHTVVLGTGQDAVQIPGSLTVSGAVSGNLNASNISTGTLDNARLGVVPVSNGGTGSATKNFVDLTTAQLIAGDKTFANTLSGNAVSSATNFRIGLLPVLSVNNFNSTFVGLHAGEANGSAASNAMFGSFAGESNTGSNNAFFGARAGATNSSGFRNAFFGSNSGTLTTSGNNNAFFGDNTGVNNIDGSFNTFLGRNSAFQNSSGSQNVFVGASTGASNTSGANNTIVGTLADVGSSNLSFATAVGAGAVVSASNTVVLGRAADSVVIPGDSLDVGGPVTATRVGVSQQFLQLNGGSGSSIRLTAQSAAAADKPLLIQNLSSEASPTSGNNIQFQVGTTASPSTKVTIDSSGNLGIGTTLPADRLEVNGSIRVATLGSAGATTLCRNASNQIATCSSSARYKSNIKTFAPGLSLVRQLRPVSFAWKDGGMLDVGLVAEEVNRIEPLLTITNENGQVEGVKYDRLSVAFINAFKEQQQQIEDQAKEIRVQTDRLRDQQILIDRLAERLSRIEKRQAKPKRTKNR